MAGALEGIRVIDFGHYIAGPLAAVMLADQGADVIHVDPPDARRWRHPADAFFNRGKRRITLDLKAESDLEIARRLIDTADVVIENFRPGVMDRLGLGAEGDDGAQPGPRLHLDARLRAGRPARRHASLGGHPQRRHGQRQPAHGRGAGRLGLVAAVLLGPAAGVQLRRLPGRHRRSSWP